MNDFMNGSKKALLGNFPLSSIMGYLTTLALVIYLNPTSVDFLPPAVQSYVKGIAGLVALASGLTLSRVMVNETFNKAQKEASNPSQPQTPTTENK